jgi:hypothetical protein
MTKNYFTIALLLFITGVFLAQVNDSKILFLEFRFIKGEPELLGMELVKGFLKTTKSVHIQGEGIAYSLVSSGNQLLYKYVTDDPSDGVYEYPADNGKFGRTTIKKDTVNLTLRVPYSSAIDKIILNKISGEKSLLKSSGKSTQSGYEFRIDHNKILNRK